MAQANDFVFLDDVQLEKQSWQTRNRLVIGGQAHWITVPIRNTQLAQTIAETEIIDTNRWREKLARGFAQNYGRHPYYAAAREVIDEIVAQPANRLAKLNEMIIRFIAVRLELTPRLHRASETSVQGVRSRRLIALCEKFGAQEYLSPLGSSQYLEEDGFLEHSPAALRFQDYVPQPYLQKGTKYFLSHLSVVDVIANLGWDLTQHYVRKGFV